ncbi:MAG: HEAT repeat domain-containing protein [Elusimicrobiota bacterium]
MTLQAVLLPLSFLFLGHAAAPQKSRTPQDALREMELICARQAKLHPADARPLEAKLEAYAVEFRSFGRKATPLLSWYIRNQERPLKMRLYAAAFLGMIADPAGLTSLKACVRDPEEDAGLRSAALLNIGSLGLSPHDLRPFLEEAAALKNPEPVIREAFSQLSDIGCSDVKLAAKAAKRHGSDPEGAEAATAAHAVLALSRCPSKDADPALLKLLRYFKKGSTLRGKVLSGLTWRWLAAKPVDLGPKSLSGEDIDDITDVVFQEKEVPALQACRLLGGLADKRATTGLVRALSRVQDPMVVAEAAQALASIGDPKAAEPLRRLHQGLASDPRFSAARIDPKPYALTIQRAAELFEAPAPEQAPAEPAPEKALAFRYEGWPGSGQPKPSWSGAVESLSLLESPRRGSKVSATFKPVPGTVLEFDESWVITVTPGRARAKRAVTLDARQLGPAAELPRSKYDGPAVRKDLVLKDGDRVEVLSYREEGQCFLRLGPQVFLAPCPQDDPSAFDMLEEPDVEWWLHAKLRAAQGWFESKNEGVEFLQR